MSISVADNFSYQGAKPLDARFQFSSVANMKAAAEATLYNGCLAYVTATKKYYTYDSSNSVDSTTGRWREFSSGGGTDENAYHTGDTAETSLADADYFPFYDASASAKRKTLWSNIKSVLKTYFDTLYSTTKTRGTATSGGTTLSLVNTGDMYNWDTDSVIYCTSSTSASTAAKVVTVSRGTFTLVAGAKVCVKFTYSNTASAPTLNVASTGAKNIKYIGTDGTVATPNTWWGAGDIVTFIYDGTQFLMQLTYGMPSMPTLGVINRSDIYSSTEKVVGCWTDGRPIYQKTTSINFLLVTWTTTQSGDAYCKYSHGISNISRAIDLKMSSFWSSSMYSCPSPNHDVRLDIDNTYYYVHVPADAVTDHEGWASGNTYLTVWYTKTTDAADSYNYADENDYSTSEKIIGTWIDGSKLFQKTISTGALPNSAMKSVPHGISNLKTVVDVSGIAYPSTGTPKNFLPMNATQNSWGFELITLVQDGNILITSSGDLSPNDVSYVTLKYTKTTG